MLYTFPVDPLHGEAAPVIAPGVGGTVAILTGREVAVPVPQTFCAATVKAPPAVPAVTVRVAVPCPAVMVHPLGTVHV